MHPGINIAQEQTCCTSPPPTLSLDAQKHATCTYLHSNTNVSNILAHIILPNFTAHACTHTLSHAHRHAPAVTRLTGRTSQLAGIFAFCRRQQSLFKSHKLSFTSFQIPFNSRSTAQVMRKSADGGLTWGPLRTIVDALALWPAANVRCPRGVLILHLRRRILLLLVKCLPTMLPFCSSIPFLASAVEQIHPPMSPHR